MGYMLLLNCSSVQQSDQLKPIISSIHDYLNINDDLREKRHYWILGFPQYVYHFKEKGYGSFGCSPNSDPAVKF